MTIPRSPLKKKHSLSPTTSLSFPLVPYVRYSIPSPSQPHSLTHYPPADEPPPSLSDDEDVNIPSPATEITKLASTLVASAVRQHATRRPPQPVSGTRANARSTVATTKRTPISAPAIPARRKSATTSALRIPLRTKPGTAASALGRSTRAVTKLRTGDGVTTATAAAPSKWLVPRAQASGVKGKGKILPVDVTADRNWTTR